MYSHKLRFRGQAQAVVQAYPTLDLAPDLLPSVDSRLPEGLLKCVFRKPTFGLPLAFEKPFL